MEEINKSEIKLDKHTLPEVIQEELCLKPDEDSNKATNNKEVEIESNNLNKNNIHTLKTGKEIIVEREAVLKNNEGNTEEYLYFNKETEQANNINDNVDSILPIETIQNNAVDHNATGKDHLLGKDFPFNIQHSLGIPHVNPASNEFNLVKDKNVIEQKLNSISGGSKKSMGMLHSDHSLVISNSNAVPLVESFVSTNYSLAQLATYESDESSHEEAPKPLKNYRESTSKIQESDDSDSDSSSSSSSTSILVSDSSDSDSCEDYRNYSPGVHKPIKSKGELDLDDLPPIEDLKISVPEDECILIGKVFQIVDKLVVIQGMRDKPAYDLDTVLFVQGGQPLGKIFDVFGPVAEPFYCIRFNSNEHIKEKNVTLNQMVYSAPKTKYTKYVFVAQLMKIKGSDASWTNDEEPPEIYLDYSDDEQEQRAKKKKSKTKNDIPKVDLDPDEPARKKHFAYEKRMNEKNLQISAIRSHQNTHKTRNKLWANQVLLNNKPPLGPSTSNVSKYPTFGNEFQPMFGNPPIFNTRLPPPHIPFPLAIRANMHSIQTPTNPTNNSPHSPNFIIPNNSQFSPHCSGAHGGIRLPNYSFPPSQLPQSIPFSNHPPNSNWNQSFSNNASVSPFNTPPMESVFHANNRIPSSPLWIQRPPVTPNTGHNTQRSPGPRNCVYTNPCPPRMWPLETPNFRNTVPSNDRFPPNFNPYAPPPSPNAPNF